MRVFFNEDMTHFYYVNQGKIVTEEDIRQYIRMYKGTTVTDYLFNVNASISSSRSQVWETQMDKYTTKHENGVDVDYTDTLASTAYHISNVQNLDLYAIWVDECRKCGMRPWLSFRMNDCHGFMPQAHNLQAKYIRQNPDKWISGYREASGYYDRNLNYTKDEVRQRIFAYIEEQIGQYDVDGVELDFTREAYSFACGEEEQGRSIIFEFVQKVRTLLDEVGKKRGKKICLSMLGQANPISAYKTGYDVAELARAGLLDFYIASPRWETVNTDLPIEIWKKLLPKTTGFGCSQGVLLRSARKQKGYIVDISTDLGVAAANAARGCDVLYLYNHFFFLEEPLGSANHESSIRSTERLKYLFDNIGKVEEADGWTRRIPVTYDDYPARSEGIQARFPVNVNLDGQQFRIPCGRVQPAREIYVHVVFEKEINPETVDIYVNGNKAVYCPDRQDKIIWAEGIAYTYAVTAGAVTTMGVDVVSKDNATLEYVDVVIPPIA